ncbi:MAG TPA: sterol desaturase family protein [Chitinophagales bacterium]|nr:sterol desaturase family protein [Chitinophagales bacterium]
MNPAYILLAIPFFFLAMGAEWLYSYIRKKDWYRLNDSVNNLVIGLGQQLWSLVSKAFLFGVYVYMYQQFAFFHIPATWWSFVLCLVVFDFFFYWAHRWGHEMNVFWAAHSVHHQSEEYNLSVALRQSWFHNILAFVIFLPIPLMGFDPKIFGLAAVLHTLYQFPIHTKAIGKMHPWIEYWLNTPSHHRVHHAVNPKYIDKNHAGVFMIWDRLFGTFQAEEEGEQIYYGITTQLKSWNPVWANTQYFVDMYQKARNMKLADKLRMIFAAPGWLPDYMGGKQPIPDPAKSNIVKYNADTNIYFKIYAILQFFVLLGGAVMYMMNYNHISLFYKVVFFVLMVLTMLIVGAIFENRRWVVYAEYARLALVMVCLNTFYYFWYINWFNFTIVVSSVGFVAFAAYFTWSYISNRSKPALQHINN